MLILKYLTHKHIFIIYRQQTPRCPTSRYPGPVVRPGEVPREARLGAPGVDWRRQVDHNRDARGDSPAEQSTRRPYQE